MRSIARATRQMARVRLVAIKKTYMDISLLVGAFIVAGGLILWRRYNDTYYFWGSLLIGGVVLIGVLQHLSNAFLQLSDDQRVVEFYTYTVLRGMAFIAIVVHTLRKLLKPFL